MAEIQLSPNEFIPVPRSAAQSERIEAPTTSFWADSWARLKRNKLSIIGLWIIVVLVIMAVVGPFMLKYAYDFADTLHTNMSPNAAHWFGTDSLGRDQWVRVWEGARVSLFIGFMAALLDLVVGILYGGIAGYYGGKVDETMMRIIEIIVGIPSLILNVLMIVYMGPGMTSIIIALAITGWVSMARLVRGQVLQLREQEFVLAARTLGAGSARLILRHLIPNVLGIIIVQATYSIPHAIFSEAILSFLGLGIRVPLASLGSLCFTGLDGLRYYFFQLLFPGVVISLIIFAFNILGDGLRDAFDPKLRK
ncbi:MAG: diguanylate cyclase [Bacilli bacterium]|nr:diguanylate cyclase [Bacilli bacterium]